MILGDSTKRFFLSLTASFAMVAGAGTGALAQPQLAPQVYRPGLSSDEGGLWMMVEQIEKDLERSPLRVTDEALTTYIDELVCNLAGNNCDAVRAYVLEVPVFNAAMYPNGTMTIYTGLLLRAENEAQLAFVLGHEIGHFLERHTLKRFRNVRDTSAFLAFLSLGAAGAGVSYVSDAASVIATGAIFSFTRDQEREADYHGFNAIVEQGYDPRQGAALWLALIDEQDANPRRRTPSAFTASHPAPAERVTYLTQRANELSAYTKDATTGSHRFHELKAAYMPQWLETELQRGEIEESIALLDRLVRSDSQSGVLQYYLGEAYYKRNEEGDLRRAESALQLAMERDGAPAGVHRTLGLIAMKNGDNASAKQSLQQYMTLAPEAGDGQMIQFYIDQL